MPSLRRAILVSVFGLAAAGLSVGFAVAQDDGGDAYYPAASGRNEPQWERPKFTRFSAMRCSAGAATIDQLTLNRDDVAESRGLATYTDSTRDQGYQEGAGGWALQGQELKVSGDGFELEGRWAGPFLTATITRTAGGQPVRCRFQVTALRSFTEYQ